MIVSFDRFNRFEPPQLTLCNPNNEELGILSAVKNLVITPVFNAVSELSAEVYEKNEPTYEKIQCRRQILVEGLGYFIISSLTENDSSEGSYKQITAVSCEIELNNKKLNYFKGTYPLYSDTNPSESLLGQILAQLPKWRAGEIDETVKTRCRTFDVPDQTVYNFLMTDLEQSYDCLVEFDILSRTINVYDKGNYVHPTSVFLSKQDLISRIELEENCEEVATALTVSGGNNLNIAYVNPLGTNTIYNFSYFQQNGWMSEELAEALASWETKTAELEPDYREILTSLIDLQEELAAASQVLNSQKNELELLLKQQSVIVSNQQDLNEINQQISEKEIEIGQSQSQVTLLQAQAAQLEQQKNAITAQLSFESNFFPLIYQELTGYFYEASYQEENITITDSMDTAAVIRQSQELYSKARELLAKLSQPAYRFSVDTENFLFSKKFQPYSSQLKTGCLIDVELSDRSVASLILQKIEVGYEEMSLKLTFGNRYRSGDPDSLFHDLYSEAGKSASTVTYNKDNWNYPVKSGLVDQMDEFIHSSIDLAKNAVINSDGQTVSIDQTGYRGKKLAENVSETEPEEIWITNNTIAFTDDKWGTSKTALGRLVLPDGTTHYGLLADVVIGDLIAGNGLTIQSASGDFVIDEDGVRSTAFRTREDSYSKEEVQSLLQQTAENIRLEFSKTGGDNIISNSAGWFGLNGWNSSGEVQVLESDRSPSPGKTTSGKVFQLLGSMSRAAILSTIPGETYAICFKYFVQSPAPKGEGWAPPTLSVNETHFVLDKEEPGWTTVSGSFPISSPDANITIDSNGALLQLSDLILIQGSTVTTWRPAQTEISSGTIQMNQDGIRITSSDSGIQGCYDHEKIQYLSYTEGQETPETVAQFSRSGSMFGNTEVHGNLQIQRSGIYSGALRLIPVSDGVMFVIND